MGKPVFTKTVFHTSSYSFPYIIWSPCQLILKYLSTSVRISHFCFLFNWDFWHFENLKTWDIDALQIFLYKLLTSFLLVWIFTFTSAYRFKDYLNTSMNTAEQTLLYIHSEYTSKCPLLKMLHCNKPFLTICKNNNK